MKQFIIILSFSVLFVFGQNASAQNTLDTLKKDIKAIGNLFKKAGTVTITVSGIDSNNTALAEFKKNVQQVAGVKKVESSYGKDAAILTVSYKGKGTELWNYTPANTKQHFTFIMANDTVIKLNYKNVNQVSASTTGNVSNAANQQAASNNTKAVPPNNSLLSEGAALLFKNIKTKLTDAEKIQIFNMVGFKISKDKKQFISNDEGADYPFDAFVYPTNFNKDDKEELFISFGNTYTSGNTGSSVIVFIADKNGVYKMNLGFPGMLPDALSTGNQGYPDLLIGGPGFTYPIWGWNGKEYVYFKEIKDADYAKVKKTNVEEASKAYTDSITF
ncbi:MAG: hypothetical protein ABJA79_10035 [Parafilimonas sp.]